jgi:hypothetical protein
MDHFSFIYHFIVSAAVNESFLDTCFVKHDGENLSDHDPIVMSLNIDWNFIARAPRHYTDKCIWHKASEQSLLMYKHVLKPNLSAVQLPIDAITCHDVACNNKTHFSTLNDDSIALINACLEAASHATPRNSRSNGDRCSAFLPGWNEHVAPLRDKSVLWHDIWVSCGRPHDGLVASIMRRTRASYHILSDILNETVKT